MNHFLLLGVIVLRKLLPKKFLKLLQLGVQDIVKNKTLHCEMAYFNGPPILHRSPFYFVELSQLFCKHIVGLQKKRNDLKDTTLRWEPVSIIHYTRPGSSIKWPTQN